MTTAEVAAVGSGAVPPGYRLTEPEARRAWERRTSRQVLTFGTLIAATATGSAHELAVRQPHAYLEPAGGMPWWMSLLVGLVGAVVGAGLATRLRRPGASLPSLMVGAAVVVGGSGFSWFGAFTHPLALDAVTWGVPLLGCAAVSAAFVAAWRALWFRAAALGVFELGLTPAFPIGAALVLGGSAGALTVVGFLRASALLGMTWAGLALWATTLIGAAERRPLRWRGGLRAAALVVFVGGLLAFSHGGRLVTVDDLRRHEGTIVYAVESPQARYVVTSAQAALALFVNDKLELSTLDGYRYAEALVHPAMTVAKRRTRVAVLGGGKGLVEREVLRYGEVESLEMVVADGTLPRLTRRVRGLSPWGRSAGVGRAERARLSIVVEEPIVWLDANGPLYDVLIVDVPDPESYGEAKNYTQYFYERLRARLAREGVAVVQATSPFRSPETFRSIIATARAAGLEVLPYRAPLPALGEWGFLLLSREPLAAPHDVREDLTFLDGPTLAAMFAAPLEDSAPARNAAPNQLYDMSLLDVFEHETFGP